MAFELYLMRHGLAEQRGTYEDDGQRPLTDEGKQKTRQVAKQLRHLGLQFDRILSSPLVRAHQTADILVDVGLGEKVEALSFLAPDGNIGDWLDWLATWMRSNESSLVLVGHEPNLSTWAEHLIWGEARQTLTLKKAGVIGLTLPETGSPIGRSSLFWLVPPRLLIGR
ncbi:MAG: phosphohistidine phosphatase SixA [Leptolyngbyaceae cyanobacterium]